MNNEYTETLEKNYPEYMIKHHREHVTLLERELRKSKVKIGELEKFITQRELNVEDSLVDSTSDKQI